MSQMVGADKDTLQKIRGDRIAMIFQEPMTSLNPLHTIERQIGETLTLHRGLSGREARARTLELLEAGAACAIRNKDSSPIPTSSPAANASA